jgi:predicted metal-dependent peptidase
MTPLDKIKKAKVSIMRHERFCAFSGVIACGKLTIDENLNPPTACTDGLNVTYHPGFVDSLTEPELRLVILHEAVHAAGKHLHMWKALWKIDRQLTNIAADHFVNLALMDMDKGEGFLGMPKIGIQPEPKYRGWNIEQIFRDLQSDPNQGKPKGGHDTHDWESAGDMTAEQQQAQAQEIDRALRQGEMMARKRSQGKGNADGIVGDLLATKVDWREQLREFVQAQCQGRDESTWRKPSRRYIGDDIYMPSSVSETMGPLVVGIDTSGSCFDGGTVTRFVSELQAVIDATSPESVRCVCWDWEVRTDQTFDQGGFDVPSLKLRGGGGTHGGVLFDYLKAKQARPAAVINFTDGEFSWPTPYDVPTLWVITNKHIRAPWGTTIHI